LAPSSTDRPGSQRHPTTQAVFAADRRLRRAGGDVNTRRHQPGKCRTFAQIRNKSHITATYHESLTAERPVTRRPKPREPMSIGASYTGLASTSAGNFPAPRTAARSCLSPATVAEGFARFLAQSRALALRFASSLASRCRLLRHGCSTVTAQGMVRLRPAVRAAFCPSGALLGFRPVKLEPATRAAVSPRSSRGNRDELVSGYGADTLVRTETHQRLVGACAVRAPKRRRVVGWHLVHGHQRASHNSTNLDGRINAS
jgi:hypothetical protein